MEDKESMAGMLREAFEAGGFSAIVASDGEAGIRAVKEGRIDLVLTDLKLPKKSGMEVLGAVREESPLTPVIIMTAYGSIETAVGAIKQGAFDFITKPFDIDHLLVLAGRAIENRRLITENMLLKEEFSSRLGHPRIIGKSPQITEVAKNIQKVSHGKTTVLITGESGTGKELFARAIHYLSPRKNYPFVPINCSAIPAGLIESELFGFEKGAFTGADARKLGKFELADKGTIFLDEIGELGMDLQAKLLRAIQEGEIERLGGSKAIKTDVRLVAASNKDLEAAVASKTFREDLFYRLNVFPIRIPPLRERKDDIPLLAEYFAGKYSAELGRGHMEISPEAMTALTNYTWKGNVRELENAIERAIILCEGKTITPEHISLSKASAGEVLSAGGVFLARNTGLGLEETAKTAQRTAETELIRATLRETGGNKSRAAERLKVSYKTLLTKIKDYGLD